MKVDEPHTAGGVYFASHRAQMRADYSYSKLPAGSSHHQKLAVPVNIYYVGSVGFLFVVTLSLCSEIY